MPKHTDTIKQWRNDLLADKTVHEQPLGSNHTKFGVEFGEDRVAWCVIYAYETFRRSGVILPVKTAGCVVLYDACVKAGLHYVSTKCVPGDMVIRTWQRLPRNARGFDPEQTHAQEVLYVKYVNGVKYLGLWGGNQGAGYVGPDVEWVRAGDASILGGLATHRLFGKPQTHKVPAKHKKTPPHQLPASKSHKHPQPNLPPAPKRAPGWFRRWCRKVRHGWI